MEKNKVLPQRILFFISLPLLLAGCTNQSLIKTLTSKSCPHHDWYRLGYTEGLQGKPIKQLKTTFPDCDSTFILEQTAYESGWQEGINQYCIPQNALRLGKMGQTNKATCPLDKQEAFVAAWKKALKTYCTPNTIYHQGQQGKDFPKICENPQYKTRKNLEAYQKGKKDFAQLASLKSQFRDIEKKIKLQQDRAKGIRHELNSLRKRYTNEPFNPETQCHLRMLQIKLKHLTARINSLMEDSKEIRHQYEAIKGKSD